MKKLKYFSTQGLTRRYYLLKVGGCTNHFNANVIPLTPHVAGALIEISSTCAVCGYVKAQPMVSPIC